MTRSRTAADALSIGDAAEATGLSVKTIHYYEEIGLIPKAPRRNGGARTGGNRLYNGAAIGRLKFVHSARSLGLSLDDIRLLIAIAEQGCPSDRPKYRDILRQHLAGIDNHIARLAGLRGQIMQLLSRKRSVGSKACCWESCDCLDADAATKRDDAKEKTRGGNASKGEDHVRNVRLQRS